MTSQAIAVPETGEMERQGSQVVAGANGITITNDEQYRHAGAFLIDVQSTRKRLESELTPPQKKAYDLWKSLTELTKRVISPFDRAESIIKAKIGEYDFNQREQRRHEAEEEQRKADARAAKEREKQIAAAKKAGDKETVKELKQAPLSAVVAQPKTPEPPKLDGVSVRYEWDFTIQNESLIPREYLTVDTAKIRRVVKALGKNAQIHGIVVHQRAVTVGRTL